MKTAQEHFDSAKKPCYGKDILRWIEAIKTDAREPLLTALKEDLDLLVRVKSKLSIWDSQDLKIDDAIARIKEVLQ